MTYAEAKNVGVRYSGEVILHLEAESAAWLADELEYRSRDQAAAEIVAAIRKALP